MSDVASTFEMHFALPVNQVCNRCSAILSLRTRNGRFYFRFSIRFPRCNKYVAAFDVPQIIRATREHESQLITAA